jgi:biopolymer transport protein ExbD
VPQPPPPGSPPPDPNDKTIIVSIDAAGVLKINSQPYEKSEVGPALLEIFRTRNERVMFINAHPDLLYNDVVEVIDIAKGSGVDKIGLMTAQIAAQPN